MTPTVTVIIPLYNAAATVGDTVRSLLAQTLTDWRAIVVDDGSTDSGVREADRAAAGDPRFSIIHQPNRGLAAARNTGLAHASGRYIHFLDSDDWLLPRGLELLVHTAESGGGGGAACGAYQLRDASGADMAREMPAPAAPGQYLTLDGLLDGNRIAPHSHIIRRDLFGNARFDERLRVVEDLDMWLRLAAGAGTESSPVRWRAADEPVAAYRLRPGSLSKNPRLMFDTVRDVLTRAYAGLRSWVPPRSAWGSASDPLPDVAPSRLDRALRTHALMYASIAALQSGAAPAPEADALLTESLHSIPAPAAAFGQAAFWATLFGLCIAPRDLAPSAHAWRPILASWWSTCRTRGLLTGDLDHAWQALAAEAIDPATVAQGLLEGAAPRLVIAGYGRNGRALAREAARRGAQIRIRDDAIEHATVAITPSHTAAAAPLDAPIPAGATVIVTPLDDAAILARLPRAAGIRRWRDERARQTEALLRSLPRSAAAA